MQEVKDPNPEDFKESWVNSLVLALPSMLEALGSIPNTKGKIIQVEKAEEVQGMELSWEFWDHAGQVPKTASWCMQGRMSQSLRLHYQKKNPVTTGNHKS